MDNEVVSEKKRIKILHEGFRTDFICDGFRVNEIGDLEIIDELRVIACFSRTFWNHVIEVRNVD